MGSRVSTYDWSQTALGPMETWSPALRMIVGYMLANRVPQLLWWGPDYISIYNDAYRSVLGAKHPWSLGKPFRDVWPEVRHILEPLIDTPFNGGQATWVEDIPLEINRHGFVEESHFTIGYSAVPDDTAPTGIGGVLALAYEITEKVVGERRVEALRELGASSGDTRTVDEAAAAAIAALQNRREDLPFAALYLFDDARKSARLAATTGVEAGAAAAPLMLAVEAEAGSGSGPGAWPIAEVLTTESIVVVDDLAARFDPVPVGPWTDPPHTAVIVPIKSNTAHSLAGVLVAGVSPRLKLDRQYLNFFELLASQLASIIATAGAYEEERRRAEALAEIDRAKTQFFSNVSHEFRTPLTLMLGPLEDALAAPAGADQRDRLEVAHRNTLRLLKLVNALLDFSRIEVGRAQAVFEAVDLSALTTELASNFRSACERAGLDLIVDCPPLPQPVQVDRDMWEKIVLNLLSNAFKFTFEGQIEVRLRAVGGQAELSVRDTGAGIPDDEMPRLFERFHRIEGQKSRTIEGSGIGLALVQELVKQHGGTIGVESRDGRGSTFTVSLPFSHAPLPAAPRHSQRAPSDGSRAIAYVQEALSWLSDAAPPDQALAAEPIDLGTGGERIRILVADDNADMRAYLRSLLDPAWEVETVSDGHAALAAIRRSRPNLVITDVMMPGLDGMGLIGAIREDADLRDLPIIMLSARAGE